MNIRFVSTEDGPVASERCSVDEREGRGAGQAGADPNERDDTAGGGRPPRRLLVSTPGRERARLPAASRMGQHADQGRLHGRIHAEVTTRYTYPRTAAEVNINGSNRRHGSTLRMLYYNYLHFFLVMVFNCCVPIPLISLSASSTRPCDARVE